MTAYLYPGSKVEMVVYNNNSIDYTTKINIFYEQSSMNMTIVP